MHQVESSLLLGRTRQRIVGTVNVEYRVLKVIGCVPPETQGRTLITTRLMLTAARCPNIGRKHLLFAWATTRVVQAARSAHMRRPCTFLSAICTIFMENRLVQLDLQRNGGLDAWLTGSISDLLHSRCLRGSSVVPDTAVESRWRIGCIGHCPPKALC